MRSYVCFTILTLFSSAALAQQPAAQGAAPPPSSSPGRPTSWP